ncbi:MAG: DUF3343 domain-containing protein [Clostridiaceae bacterium]|jgi:hypothetical protein|nr:DUF3343 domain-containing protein [Clostridiaceae bacterium]
MKYIATFYTHFGAFSFHKRLERLGDKSVKLIAAPRKISVSCGTAVSFSQDFAAETMADEDTEAVYLVTDDGFTLIYHNE